MRVRCRKFAPLVSVTWRRRIQVSTQSSDALDISPSDTLSNPGGPSSDARFEVLGSSFALLSVSLSASQNLYTRRGSLVALGGNAENAISTLSILEPFRRALLCLPFLYQRISSTSPITALISTKAANTCITTVNLDGRTDWMLAGNCLMAFTGQTLSITPTANYQMNVAHWGNSQVTGRGLLALAGQGTILQVVLGAGESYLVHPSNVMAYTMSSNLPSPYRLRSSSFNLQIPRLDMNSMLPESRFLRAMKESSTWQNITNLLYRLRTWARATIWGDRLFLNFHGPATVLLQTRASRMSDVLTPQDVNEIADAAPGLIQPLAALSQDKEEPLKPQNTSIPTMIKVPKMSTASIGSDGKVTFEPKA